MAGETQEKDFHSGEQFMIAELSFSQHFSFILFSFGGGGLFRLGWVGLVWFGLQDPAAPRDQLPLAVCSHSWCTEVLTVPAAASQCKGVLGACPWQKQLGCFLGTTELVIARIPE